MLLTLYGVPQGCPGTRTIQYLCELLLNCHEKPRNTVFVLCRWHKRLHKNIFKISISFNNSCVIPHLLEVVNKWMSSQFLKLNINKTEIVFPHPSHLKSVAKIKGIFYQHHCIWFSDAVKLLGIHVDENLNFDKHVSTIVS